jgi:hypothetical protein
LEGGHGGRGGWQGGRGTMGSRIDTKGKLNPGYLIGRDIF